MGANQPVMIVVEGIVEAANYDDEGSLEEGLMLRRANGSE